MNEEETVVQEEVPAEEPMREEVPAAEDAEQAPEEEQTDVEQAPEEYAEEMVQDMEEPVVLSNDNKELTIFTYYRKLQMMIKYFMHQMVLLDDSDSLNGKPEKSQVADECERLFALEKDMKFYLDMNWDYEEYNKNLYMYLVFNKRFANILGNVRKYLKLDKKED